MNLGEEGADPVGSAPDSTLFERLIAVAARLGAHVAAAGVLLILSVTGYSVFQRYVLGTPVTWTDELSGFLVVGVVMFGAAETLRRGEHISVDLLTARAKGVTARAFSVWGMVAVLLLMVAVLTSSIVAVRFSWDFDMYSDGYLAVQMWVPQSALIVGSVLVMLVAVARLASLVRKGSGDR